MPSAYHWSTNGYYLTMKQNASKKGTPSSKSSKIITIHDDVRRFEIFVGDIIGVDEAKKWMKEKRPEWRGQTAIQMIHDDFADQVMLLIHSTLFRS